MPACFPVPPMTGQDPVMAHRVILPGNPNTSGFQRLCDQYFPPTGRVYVVWGDVVEKTGFSALGCWFHMILLKTTVMLHVFIPDTLGNDYNYIEKRVQITWWAFSLFKLQEYICASTPVFPEDLNQNSNISLCVLTKYHFNHSNNTFHHQRTSMSYLLSPLPHLTFLLLTLKYFGSFPFIEIFSDGDLK